MKSVKVFINTIVFGYWATIKPYTSTSINFCYETQTFETKKEILKEVRDFCKGKKMKKG